MLWYSLTDWDGLDLDKQFVGLDNYVEVFTNPQIFSVFGVSLYYFVGSFLQMAIALYFAALLSYRTRFSNFFRGILFFPYLINGVAIGFVFLYLFQPGGTLDTVLSWVGLSDPPHWLGDPAIANYSLAATSVWRYTGLNFVLFLGAIQSIPGELYEAAEIDGARLLRRFWHVTIPQCRLVLSLMLMLQVISTMQMFIEAFLLANGSGPEGATTTVVYLIYQHAFNLDDLGGASALGVLLLLVLAAFAAVYVRLDRPRG
jgi:multiple sugar transport system permease protein